MSLSTKDYQLLMALEANPLMSLTDLADKMEVSWPTVKKRISELEDIGLIHNPTTSYNAEKMGLRRVNVIAMVETHQQMELLEFACREHPYTIYRARFSGEFFGLFMQFNIPSGSIDYLELFFQILIQHDIIYRFEMLGSTGLRYDTTPDLSRFDQETNKWNFSWSHWVNELDILEPLRLPIIEIGNIKSGLKPTHLDILRLLTENGSIKQTEIMKRLNLSKSATHRYYNSVINDLITSVRLNYDRAKFDLTETYIGIIKGLTEVQLEQIFYQLQINPPPFKFSIDFISNNSIVFWSSMSPTQSNDFAYAFWKKFTNFRFIKLNTIENNSARYWFYPPNFDFQTYSWRDSIRYMVHEPISRLIREIRNKSSTLQEYR